MACSPLKLFLCYSNSSVRYCASVAWLTLKIPRLADREDGRLDECFKTISQYAHVACICKTNRRQSLETAHIRKECGGRIAVARCQAVRVVVFRTANFLRPLGLAYIRINWHSPPDRVNRSLASSTVRPQKRSRRARLIGLPELHWRRWRDVKIAKAL